MLVPSISSRLNIGLEKLLETVSDSVDGPLMISAYDFDVVKDLEIDFPSLIFLDSGGYECAITHDIPDACLYSQNQRDDWNQDKHKSVLDNWKSNIPTVAISYDHPSLRTTISNQIGIAADLFSKHNRYLKEIIIKPETVGAIRIPVEKIVSSITAFRGFDVIGFTEKELGHSVLERMVNISKIRKALDREDLRIPIHIFGSLDPIITPLYFFSGADIFDGLSWLRFTFEAGDAKYTDSCGPKLFDASTDCRAVWGQSVAHNVTYIRKLELDLGKFVTKQDFDAFGTNADFFKKTFDDFEEKTR